MNCSAATHSGHHVDGYRSRGFTLVEIAVVLVVIGLIASGAGAAYMGLLRNGNKMEIDARLVTLSESVIAFAKTRHRLPCPDSVGLGYEALDASGVCPGGIDVGWLPYLSIGLSQPSTQQRAIYGVYRNTLTTPASDLANSATPSQFSIAASQAASSNYVYVTGDGSTANGVEDCTNNIRSNPAFVLLAAGEDRDGDGGQVDGIHASLPGSGRCFAAPTRGNDTHFDDRTLAVSSYAMLAKLNP